MSETDLDENAARDLMNEADNDLRVAIVMHKAQVSREIAQNALTENDFVIEKTLDDLTRK